LAPLDIYLTYPVIGNAQSSYGLTPATFWLCGLHLLFSLIMHSLVRHHTEKAGEDAYSFENLNQTQGIIQ